MPPPHKVIAFEKNGSTYVEIIGSLPGFPTVPSGPPAYIFDSSGRIAYWTGDTGDSTEYWENWQHRSNIREISLSEALQGYAEGRKENQP
jgi:saccharopine dehydrogenase-like NADP-dependent oxidoreductase